MSAGRWTLGAVIATHRYARVHATGDPSVMVAVLERDADEHVLEALIAEPRSYNEKHDGMVFDIVDAGPRTDGTVYLSMELVPGKLLTELFIDAPRCAPDVVTRFGAALLEGLAAIHARGFIHGEVRPDAILVAPDGQPRIMHVGIAMLAATRSNLRLEGGMRGWAPYKAPEQIADDPPDPRSDLYAVGAILYQLATGALAFDGESVFEILDAHRTQRPVPPRKRVPEMPKTVERVILRALERDPADRFASADEMRAALLA